MLGGDLDEGLIFGQIQLDRDPGLGSDVKRIRARVLGRFVAVKGQRIDQTLSGDAFLGDIHKLLRWRLEMTGQGAGSVIAHGLGAQAGRRRTC